MQGWEKQPPSHLAAYSVALPEHDQQWPELHEYQAPRFSLKCPCSSEEFCLTLRHDSTEALNQPPVEMTCSQCGRSALVFDPRHHGYEGQFGTTAEYWTPPDDILEYACSQCGAHSFQVAYTVQPLELEDPSELSDMDSPNDYFMWFAVAVACRACSAREELISWECA